MWLDQGVPIEQSLQQGYGRYCRMTGGDSQNPRGSTLVHDEVDDSTGDARQRTTRSQQRGAGPSSSVQSITATIYHMSLATAMSQMNENGAGHLDKGGSLSGISK